MKNDFLNKLFFYSKQIFLYSDAKISKAEIAPHIKKEQGEKELDVAGLVEEANQRIAIHSKILNEMPDQYAKDFKKSIVSYFINSADRFDKDQEKGLDKYEFAQYKANMLAKINSIVSNHEPSKEEKAAAERQRAEFEAAKRKFETGMQKEISASKYGTKLSDADLEKKGRIPQEMFKVQKDNAWIQNRVQGVSEQISRFMPQLQKWNSMSKSSRHANQGMRIAVTGSMATIQRAKTEILPELRKAQREVHEHGKKLSKAAKILKEKFIKKRNEVIKKAEEKAQKKRNEKAYGMLDKAKDNFRLQAGITPEAALARIDNIMANPFKYGLSPEGMRKLIRQRAMIAKLVGRPTKLKGFDNELFGLNQQVGRTLEVEQQKNGGIKEILMAKFAPMEDALNKQIEDVNNLSLQADIQNSRIINMMESSMNKFLSNKVADTGNAWTGFMNNVIGFGIKYPFEKAAKGLYKAADYFNKETKHFKWLGSACDFVGGTVDSVGDIGKGLAMLVGDPAAAGKGLITLVGAYGLKNAGKAWKGMGNAILATDEFGKGNYARGSGKAAGNIATFFLTGGAAAGVKGVGVAGKLGRLMGRVGRATGKVLRPVGKVGGRVIEGTVDLLRRGGKKLPASARRAAEISAEKVSSVSGKTSALTETIIGLAPKTANKVKSFIIKLRTSVYQKLGKMSDKAAYEEFYRITKQIQKKTGSSVEKARKIAQQEFAPLWEKTRRFVKKSNLSKTEKFRKAVSQTTGKSKEVGKKVIDRLRQSVKFEKTKRWLHSTKETIKSKLSYMPEKTAYNEFSNITNAISKKMGISQEQAMGIAIKEFPQLWKKGVMTPAQRYNKELYKMVEQGIMSALDFEYYAGLENLVIYWKNAGYAVKSNKFAKIVEKLRIRSAAKTSPATARRAPAAATKVAPKSAPSIAENFASSGFKKESFVKMPEGGVNTLYEVVMVNGDQVMLRIRGTVGKWNPQHAFTAEWYPMSKVLKYNKRPLTLSEAEQVLQKMNPKKASGAETKAKTSKEGNTASGTIGAEKVNKAASRMKNNADKMRQRGHDFMPENATPAQYYERLGFKNGDSINVLRSNGQIEKGWVIDRVLQDGSVRAYKVVGKEAGSFRDFLKQDIVSFNKKGPLSSGKFEQLQYAKNVREFNRLGFKEGSEISVLRSSGKIDTGWKISRRNSDGTYRAISPDGKWARTFNVEEILKINPRGPRRPNVDPRMTNPLQQAQESMIQRLELSGEQINKLKNYTRSTDQLELIQKGLDLMGIKSLKGVSEQVFKKKFRELSVKYHPDRLSDATKATQQAAKENIQQLSAAKSFFEALH